MSHIVCCLVLPRVEATTLRLYYKAIGRNLTRASRNYWRRLVAIQWRLYFYITSYKPVPVRCLQHGSTCAIWLRLCENKLYLVTLIRWNRRGDRPFSFATVFICTTNLINETDSDISNFSVIFRSSSAVVYRGPDAFGCWRKHLRLPSITRQRINESKQACLEDCKLRWVSESDIFCWSCLDAGLLLSSEEIGNHR